jgi:tetratricopeptide (TPR) repeat protein
MTRGALRLAALAAVAAAAALGSARVSRTDTPDPPAPALAPPPGARDATADTAPATPAASGAAGATAAPDALPIAAPTAPPASAPSAAPRARGAQLLLAGKGDEAAAAYAEALAADPGDELAMEGRVRALIDSGRWTEALADARRFAAAKPRSAPAASALGAALLRAGRIPEASAALTPLAATEKPPARALMTLGLVRVAEGNEDEGAGLLDRALALAPEDRDVIRESAGAAQTRAEAVARLTRYLDRSAGDDPDRIEGAKGTIRTYKALGERRVWVRVSRPDHVEVPLASVRNPNGSLAGLSVELAAPPGKPIRVLLDTGSTGLFLVERIAAKAGLSPLAEETTFGGGGEGRHANKTGLLARVAIGDLRFTDALVTTTTQEIEPTGRYHGVLGLSIFQGYRVTIDLAREKLILELPVSAAAGSAAAGSASGADAPSASPAPPPSPAGSPYWSVESQMLVEAATADGRSGLFLFDTGATASLLSLDFADAAKAWIGGQTNARGYGGVLRDAREVRGVKLRFQGLETNGAPMTASDLSQRSRLGGVEVSGYLGLDLLARTLVTVDTTSRRVAVTRPGKR